MLKKIYKKNGFIYISEKENNIKINYLFIKLFIKYKDTIHLKDIHNLKKISIKHLCVHINIYFK